MRGCHSFQAVTVAELLKLFDSFNSSVCFRKQKKPVSRDSGFVCFHGFLGFSAIRQQKLRKRLIAFAREI